MPLLDVSEILLDPDFVTLGLICSRQVQMVNEDGLATNTPVIFTFSGVVTSISGEVLNRIAIGERISGKILICTRFRLMDGNSANSADIITINKCGCSTADSLSYTVVQVNNYSKYGAGFVEAVCELIPLSG